MDNNVIQDVQRSDKDWVVTLILSIFLGTIGVHRFYVGKTGTGILTILTLGVTLSLAYSIIILAYSIIPLTIPFFTTLVFIFYLIILIKGVTAIKKDMNNKIPVISDIANSLFKNLIDKKRRLYRLFNY